MVSYAYLANLRWLIVGMKKSLEAKITIRLGGEYPP